MTKHFKEVCRKCRTVVSQCRCPDPNKKVTYVICEDCLKKIGDGVQPNPASDVDESRI